MASVRSGRIGPLVVDEGTLSFRLVLEQIGPPAARSEQPGEAVRSLIGRP